MDLEKINIKKDIKIIFMGTPHFSVPILQGLIDNYKVRAVVTQPDKLVGRNQKISAPPIKELANENLILVLQPPKVKDAIEEIKNFNPDLIITCAYGQILPQEILEIPRLGCINVHASLLPKLRGGAPIHRAIINGHTKTGITIMYMDRKMDAGDIISQEEIAIEENDTASTLHDKLSILGAKLLIKTLPSILEETNKREKQKEEEVTYGYVITRKDEKINFSDTTKEIYNQVRGLNSWPGAYAVLNDKVIKVWECRKSDNYFHGKFDGEITAIYEDGIGVKTSNGEIILTLIQPEGKAKMKAIDYANGQANKEPLVGKMFK